MAITVMAAADTDATRTLIADMPDWIDRRRRMSDGCCTGRNNLRKAYGQMDSPHVDMGASCGEFEKVTSNAPGCMRTWISAEVSMEGRPEGTRASS